MPVEFKAPGVESVQHRIWDSYADIPAHAGVERDDQGTWYRNVTIAVPDRHVYDENGKLVRMAVKTVRRAVALSLDEAVGMTTRGIPTDYFSPVVGWIRDGRKPERDTPEVRPASRLADDDIEFLDQDGGTRPPAPVQGMKEK